MGFANPSERPLPKAKRKRSKPVATATDSERGRSAQRAAGQTRGTTDSERGRSAARARSASSTSENLGAALVNVGAGGTLARRKRKERPSTLSKAKKVARTADLVPRPDKLLRVGGAVLSSAGAALAHDPVATVKNTGQGIKEAAKGIPGAVAGIALAGYDLAHGDPTGAKDLAKAGAATYTNSYGDIYKAADPVSLGKAIKKNAKRIEKEGLTQELLDASAVLSAAPLGLSVARGVARASKPGSKVGKAAAAVAGPRALLRKTPGGPAETQRKRRTLVGASASAGVDAARRRKQKRMVREAADTGAALPPNRAALTPGEIAPLRSTAKRSAARRGSKYATDERAATGLKTRRELTGRKGPGDHPDALTARAQARALPAELRTAAKLAQQLGIRSGAAAAPLLRAHLASIERDRAARPVTDVEAALRPDEAPAIQALIDDPSPFDNPAVHAYADTEGARTERIRKGAGRIGDDRARAARRQPQDQALGIKSPHELHQTALSARAEAIKVAKSAAKSDTAEARRALARAERAADTAERRAARAAGAASGSRRDTPEAEKQAVDAASEARAARMVERDVASAGRLPLSKAEIRVSRAEQALAKATGRAEVLSRNVGGRGSAGAHGVNLARAELESAKLDLAHIKRAGTETSRRLSVERSGAERVARKARLEALRQSRGERLGGALDATGAARSAARDEAGLARAELAVTKSVHRNRLKQARAKPVRESDADFEARRSAVVADAGLVEPGFVRSRYEDPDTVPSVRGIGRARPAATSTSQHREGELFARGQESDDPRTQEKHLQKLIREGEQLKTESDILEREGMRFDSRALAEAYRSRLPEKERALWDIDEPPLVRQGLAPATGPPEGDYVPTDSAWLLPTKLVDELTKQRTPLNSISSALLRTNAGAQATLLALSPKWFIFQILADSATLTAAGGASQILRNTREYRTLPDAAKDVADVAIGGSPRSDALLQDEGVKLGVVGRMLDKNEFFQDKLKGRNPLTTMLRAEGTRAHEFRRAALMTELRKNDITKQIDAGIVAARKPLSIISKAMAKPDPAEAVRLLSDRQAVETAMKHVDEIMGNFSRYTHAERAALRPMLGFYGFLRFATRMAFWTLPVGHPIAANIAGHLGNMSAERAKDILGEDMAHQVGVWYGRDKKGAVRKLDLRAANPAASALLNLDDPAKVLSLMGPAWTAAMSTILGRNLFLNAPMTINNDPTPAEARDIGFLTPERGRIALRQALNLLPPVRAINEAYPLKESDTSLPFSRHPHQSLNPKTRAELELANAERAREGGTRRVLKVLLPPGVESASSDLNKARRAAKAALTRAVDQAAKLKRLEEFYDDPDKILDKTEEEVEKIESGEDIDALMDRYDELVDGG